MKGAAPCLSHAFHRIVVTSHRVHRPKGLPGVYPIPGGRAFPPNGGRARRGCPVQPRYEGKNLDFQRTSRPDNQSVHGFPFVLYAKAYLPSDPSGQTRPAS